VASLLTPQLKRLLSYVRPYTFRLTLGVVLVAIVALAEGFIALMVKPAVDYVLDPSVVGGISVHIGDELIDGTAASRLAEVRRKLAG